MKKEKESWKSTGFCILETNPCLCCERRCSHPRPATIEDLKNFSLTSTVLGRKMGLPYDIIFSTEKNEDGNQPYRDFRLNFNKFRIRYGKIKEVAQVNPTAKIGYLMISQDK